MRHCQHLVNTTSEDALHGVQLDAEECVDDPTATLARGELIVDKLRNCFVCDGWTIDEEAASRTLN